ncbi:MAG: siderophore-interacting protein [Stellaceae bacterium]
MDDAIPRAARPVLSEAELERRRGRPWTLVVTDSARVSPRMLRLGLTAQSLNGFEPKPAQEIVLQIPQAAGEPARRHYTIRRFDRAHQRIEVDFLLHGHGTPGERWALEAKPGASIDIRGPRGRIALSPAAEWQLFSGDETAMPAILALLEALPPGAKAKAFIEIGSDAERMLPAANSAAVTWLTRGGAPAAPNTILADAVAAFTLPAGRGHAIILGETSGVRAIRHALLARGLTREQIYSEGYWRPDRIGGHDHVED